MKKASISYIKWSSAQYKHIRERSSIMSARLGGVGGLIKNADTADAGEGGGGSLIKC